MLDIFFSLVLIQIDAEFKKLQSEARDFLATFPTKYAKQILKYTRQHRTDIYERMSLNTDGKMFQIILSF